MGVLSTVVAQDIGFLALKYFVRGDVLSQTTQDKPLLRILREKQKSFPLGNQVISEPVQGAYMVDTAGFFVGYSEDDALTFTQGQNALRAEYNWYEHHAGLEMTGTELKKDGITLSDHSKTSEHSRVDLTRLGSIMKNRTDDYMESWLRAFNKTLWLDGSQDAKAVPGVTSILTDTPNASSTGGLSRATYVWWRHRARLGALAVTANTGPKITAAPSDQTLTKTLRSELRQLRRFGGKPDIALCGSQFIEALEDEVHEKGVYTQEGFVNEGKTNIGMASISLKGLGKFEYDPTLDDLGYSKRCYVIDSRRLKLQPMEGEDMKVLKPERPYNVIAWLQSMTWTGGLVANQLNCHGVYEVA